MGNSSQSKRLYDRPRQPFTIKKNPNPGFRPVLPKKPERQTQKISFEEVSEIFSKMRLSSDNQFRSMEGDLTKLGADPEATGGDRYKKGFTTTANNQPVKVGEGMEDLD